MAHNKKTIWEWFELFKQIMEDNGLLPSDIWNFDETGFNIGMAGETVIITKYPFRRHHTPSSENRTRITSIEAVNVAGDYLPAFHILPGKCLLANWFPDCHPDNYLVVSDTGYSNKILDLEYIKKFNLYNTYY